MIEVWGRRNASNVLPVMWTIGELQIPFVRHDVGGSFGAVDTPEFLAMNPNGRIPVVNDDGFIIWESNAIVRYLCMQYGQKTLAPQAQQSCATADQWMEWHKTTLYPDYIDLFWAIVRTEPALRDSARIGTLAKSVSESLKILDAQLARHHYVAGETLTMADLPIGPMIHRFFQLEIEHPRFPNVMDWYQRLRDRPPFREHVMFPFGGNPAEWYTLERVPTTDPQARGPE